MDDQLMKEFVGIVTERLRDVHVAGNRLIRENSPDEIEQDLDPLITPFGIIITTIRLIIDDGEEYYGTDY